MKRPVLGLFFFLTFLPAFLITYRVLFLGYPLLPASPEKAWELSMNARIEPHEKEVNVKISVPSGQAGQAVVEEKFISGTLDFNLLREGLNRVGVWSGQVGSSGETIGYRALLFVQPQQSSKSKPADLEPFPSDVGEAEQALAKRLAARWHKLGPLEKFRAMAATVTDHWEDTPPGDQDVRAWTLFRVKHGLPKSFLVLLRAADLPARAVEGFPLTESVTSTPVTWVEVWTGKNWTNLFPLTGKIEEKTSDLLPLTRGGLQTVRIQEGELSEIRWILSKRAVSRWRHHFERIRQSGHFLDRWSLFHLPLEFQNTFRILLLVPIGALMISVLRNIVGFPTFGVFMPVLMAIAFRNTGLAYGLIIFGGVILIGFFVRQWLDRLHLLLVPRLSLILTLVIASITLFALIGNKFGLRQLMAVGLLPFVILTMTIERFFIIVEEAGFREGFRTALGSTAVAVITHEILHLESLQITFFVYPELLMAVAAAQVLLGRYTGYRLSELIRFRKMRPLP
jgi:hypothetical protein